MRGSIKQLIQRGLVTTAGALLMTGAATAVVPYSPLPPSPAPLVGPGVPGPKMVTGKEFSHDIDFSVASGAATPDPEQVLLWDGAGGVADGIDFSGTRATFETDRQVDAIAHHHDMLFRELRGDYAHLIFSHDDEVAAPAPGGFVPMMMPSAGPVFLTNGMAIGGAGELSVEEAGVFAPPSLQTPWASQPEISAMPLPVDVDGVEVWGPEPSENMPMGDTDKYSLELDFESGTSVWNASGTPYISHSMIVGAVTSLLGPIPGPAILPYDDQEGPNAINLDALMVQDVVGDFDVFDIEQPGGEGGREADAIIFSIRQIMNPADPDGYYATGSELFVLDALSGASFLSHGGHVWDHGYSLAALRTFDEETQELGAVIDVNAIEAIAEVPLPGDYNNDGSVDAADYTVWRDTEGSTGPGLAADGNGDFVIDSLDYDVWVANYGVSVSPAFAMASAVPEPTSAMLTLLATAGLAVARRR